METLVDWMEWERAGYPAPGVGFHAAMMPYARSSAADARAGGAVGKAYREAAVLIGLESDGTIRLIERTGGKDPHGGQMALPGGAREPGETMRECAVREWQEELGLGADCRPLRTPVALTEVHVVPSGFVVRPYVAPVRLPDALAPEATEVAAVHRIRVGDLSNGRYRTTESVQVRLSGRPTFKWPVPGFALPGVPFIWGATALMLSELAEWYRCWGSKGG